MTLGNASPLDDIDLVVFDLFGTLIEITDRRRPFAHLKRKMTPEKALKFRRLAMTTEMTLSEIDAELQGGATVADLVVAQTAIAHEVASVRIRPGVQEILAALPAQYGLCSNLSLDYVPTLDRFPEITPMFRILSCFAGCMKPDPRIYELVLEAAGVPADRILFVGDTPSADIDGPAQAGMRAVHIDAFLNSFAGGDKRDDFGDAFRAARGTVSRDLDIES
ncbi:HAD family hydrolase [Roseovarius sp.]|uniref:HAD family hydrolase n=1 Tax=Roseovarius sp. TaxID=1486281 RepID=UPI00356B354A